MQEGYIVIALYGERVPLKSYVATWLLEYFTNKDIELGWVVGGAKGIYK